MVYFHESPKYTLLIDKRDGYMRVTLEGQNSFDDSQFIWEKIIRECSRYKCRRILVVSNLKTYEAAHALRFKNLFCTLALPQIYKIAWVENNPDNQKMVRFIEMICSQMGLKNVLHFYNEHLAKSWLLMGKTQRGTET